MSLIIPRNFKRANAQDAAAQDIKLPFIITFNNGKKEFREGYSEEEVRRRFDKSVAALYGGIKSVKLEDEDKRNGKDSISDKEREYTRLYELAQKNITFYAAKGDSAKVAEWKRKADEYKRLAQEAENAASDAAEFHVGQRVRAKDPAYEYSDGKALGAGMFTVKEVNNNGDVKLDDYGDVWISPSALVEANDACKDSSELNNDADLRAALSKMADIAKRLTDAKVSFKAGWTPEGIGEIILDFPNTESARKYNYYKLFNAWEAARSQIVPRWALNIGGYRVPRIEGNRMTISVLHFST